VPLHAGTWSPRRAFTNIEDRSLRLQRFLAECGWPGPTPDFLDVMAARIQASVSGLQALATRDALFARIVAEGGRLSQNSPAELRYFALRPIAAPERLLAAPPLGREQQKARVLTSYIGLNIS
jgi:hypothetical protein